MVPADSGVEQTPAAMPRLDPDSAGWLRVLAGTGAAREAALARLHEMLVRIARGEVARRAPRLRLTGPELDDLAYQAAADALIAITVKLGQFRGESRFTTWAYRFVILEVSAKLGQHFWRRPDVRLEAAYGDTDGDREMLALAEEQGMKVFNGTGRASLCITPAPPRSTSSSRSSPASGAMAC